MKAWRERMLVRGLVMKDAFGITVAFIVLGCLLLSLPGCQATALPGYDRSPATATAAITLLGTPVATSASSIMDIEPTLGAWRAAGLEPFCLVLADTDGDAEKEWVGLHQARVGTTVGVQGFVLDDGQFHLLGATEPYASSSVGFVLGDDALPALAVHDVNADGKVEILVGGQSRDGHAQLSVFAWDNRENYELLAQFSGGEGVHLRDADNDGVAEIVAVSQASPGVLFEETSVWDGEKYVLWRGRYLRAPSYSGHLPVSTPEQTLIAYYLSLQARDMTAAYELLGWTMQQRQRYDAFLLSQAAVENFDLGELQRIRESDDDVSLVGRLWLSRASAERTSREGFQGEWLLSDAVGEWRIESISLIPER